MSFNKNSATSFETSVTVTLTGDNGPKTYICSGVSNLILPNSPQHGQEVTVKDGSGDATLNPITITGSHYIDNGLAAFIDGNYDSKTVRFNTTANQWYIV